MPIPGRPPAGPRGPAEDGGSVPGPGSDLENPVRGPELGRFGHGRDDVGLGDRLARVDRQGAVVVGGVDPIGVTATQDRDALLGLGADCICYMAHSDVRPGEVVDDLCAAMAPVRSAHGRHQVPFRSFRLVAVAG